MQLPALREIGPLRDAQCFRPLHRQLAVAAHLRCVERRYPQELLGLDEVGVEVAGPAHPVLVAPVVEHLVRRPEAGARVDHRRAADHFRDRDGDRRVALGHGQAGVAVQRRDRVEMALRVVVAVEVVARLEHDHVEPRLREFGRRGRTAGARADDHHVAFLAVAGRRRLTERARRAPESCRRPSGSWPVSSAQGADITTLEGLAKNGKLHPLQQAWIDEQVPACGYCQNGQIMTAKALLDKNPNPTDAEIRQGMANTLCRCMTYYRIQSAIKRVVTGTKSADAAADREVTA